MAEINWMQNRLTGDFNKDFSTSLGLNQNTNILGNTTSNKLDLSLSASSNPTLKPYTNGGWNVGMTSALLTGALGMMADYTQSRYNAKALRAQANAYEAQLPLNYEAYRTNVNYLSEENFANVSRIIDEYEALSGAQMAAMGASGFDVSTGDQRILKDTQQKMRNEVYLANRSTYLQSFEMWRSTMMEENRLLAAAASARSQAKYIKKMSKVNLISGAISTAAGVMAAAYGPRLATVGGTK